MLNTLDLKNVICWLYANETEDKKWPDPRHEDKAVLDDHNEVNFKDTSGQVHQKNL